MSDFSVKLGQAAADLHKTAGVASNMLRKGVSMLGGTGIRKGVDAGVSAFKPAIKSVGSSVPDGALQTQRQAALASGNNFVSTFKPQGFAPYAGRVKTPESIAGHGLTTAPDDLLGLRYTSAKGYGPEAVNDFIAQLGASGAEVVRHKKVVSPGYHGWNIKAKVDGTPTEFQLSPRRLQGFSAANHGLVYKPHETGVIPALGQAVYRPLLSYGMNMLSPFNSASKRLAYAAPLAATPLAAGSAYMQDQPDGADEQLSAAPDYWTPPLPPEPQQASQPPLTPAKTAAAYQFSGDVQGVGLRKLLHQILDQHNAPGLAYNNARTGVVHAVLPGPSRKREQILQQLRDSLNHPGRDDQLQDGVDYKIEPLNKSERLKPVELSDDDIVKFTTSQGFTRLGGETLDYRRQWLQNRYRLKFENGRLTGRVPTLAHKQLTAGEPIYNYQLEPGYTGEAPKVRPNQVLNKSAGIGSNLLRKLSPALKPARSVVPKPTGMPAAPATPAVPTAITKPTGMPTTPAPQPGLLSNAANAAQTTFGTTLGAGLGAQNSDDPWTGALAGGMAGLAASNPTARNFMRNQVRYMGQATPGKAMGPREYARAFFKPKYPGIEPALERALPVAGPRIANTVRALPYASMAIGTGLGVHGASTMLPNELSREAYMQGMNDMQLQESSYTSADNKKRFWYDIKPPKPWKQDPVANRVWWDTFKSQPELLWRSYAPEGMGRDTTAVGDLHRKLVSDVMIPSLKGAPAAGRKMYPKAMAAADTLRSVTPFGALQTYLMRQVKPPTGIDGATADVLTEMRDQIGKDPNLSRSPMAEIYGDILLKPDSATADSFRFQVGRNLGRNVISDGLPSPVATGTAAHVLRGSIGPGKQGPAPFALQAALNSPDAVNKRLALVDNVRDGLYERQHRLDNYREGGGE